MPNSQPPAKDTGKLRQRRKSVPEVLEILSLAASGVGIGLAFVTEQVLHAAVPLTLSMSLGVFNRQRFHQRMQEQYREAVTQLHDSLQMLPDPVNLDPVLQKVVRLEQSNQRMGQQIESLQREMRMQANPQQMTALREAIATLQADLEQMQSYASQQRQREQQLMEQIEQLHQWYERLPTTQQTQEYQRMENAIALLHRELAVVKGRLAPLEGTDMQAVRASILQLQHYLQELANGVVPLRRRQKDMVRRLFPRMIELLNELRPSEMPQPQEARKAAAQRPGPPTVNHTLRQGPLAGRPEPPPRPSWQVQAEILRQRAHHRQRQHQRQGDTRL